MKCLCQTGDHDKELGCVVDHDGHFGDFCDACSLRCFPVAQADRHPELKLRYKQCQCPMEHRLIHPPSERGNPHAHYCKRCKRHWST